MSLHILDIAENSVNAGATRIEIEIEEDLREDRFTLKVMDNGRGMELEKKSDDQFYTSKKGKRFGLGIPLLKQAAVECNGDFSISPGEKGGTTLVARFQRSHVDMRPLGDVGSTMTVLIGGHPDIDYMLLYSLDGYSYTLDTSRLREELEGLPLNVPAVLKYIRQEVNEGISGAGKRRNQEGG